MTSDAGLTSQDTDDVRHIQEVLNELQQMQQTPRLVTSPDELEALEREIRQRTDRLGSLLVGLSPPAGVGFRGLASRARAAGAPVAQTAQKRWQGQGGDAHGSRAWPCRCG